MFGSAPLSRAGARHFQAEKYCFHYGTFFQESKAKAAKKTPCPAGHGVFCNLNQCSAAQISAAHALVGQQFGTGAIHDHTAGLKDVGAVGHGKG